MQVVNAGSPEIFDALLYPRPHQNVVQYLEQQYDRYAHLVTEAGRSFIERGRELYAAYRDNDAYRYAQSAINQMDNLFQPDTIRPLETYDQLKTAQCTMQRWMMAQTSLRRLYQDQRCHGFQDTYIDADPGHIGEEHYDYRRVMQGVIQYDAEDNEFFRYYIEDLMPDDRPLTSYEQFDILSTWDVIELAIASQQDPSDPYGGRL